ncbi:E3 ubiquitin-protein ligase WAV3-like [Andrographis paniculata]|uniref:E3 ubiquitin-protein ligase WAV3-like n=1 Tax=Andrographis paniculata TaxID=175694 RepID=UPI0021E73453|nr:E3 ubiquitin-protein ligase WAV3-like [Andrographis paniculata]
MFAYSKSGDDHWGCYSKESSKQTESSLQEDRHTSRQTDYAHHRDPLMASSSSRQTDYAHHGDPLMASSSYRARRKYDTEPPYIKDDELLPSAISIPSSCLPKIDVLAIPQYPSVIASDPPERISILFRIKAPSMSDYPDYHPLKRAAIDLVLVLDFNGYINRKSFDHVRKAVGFVIDQLSSSDRLSIVSSYPKNKKVLPLCLMTDQRKENAKQTVSKLVFTKGPIDAVKVLRMAARVLEKRRYKNTVAFVMLLSDRRDHCITWNHESSNREKAIEYLDKLPYSIYPLFSKEMNSNFFKYDIFPVYAFGIGPYHEPVGLHALCSATGGTYSSLETPELLPDAIACCLGGLLSVVTIEFSLTFKQGMVDVKILELESGDFYSIIRDTEGTSADIKVGNLFADEVKEFLIEVSLPTREIDVLQNESILTFLWAYKDAVTYSGTEVQYCHIVNIDRKLRLPWPMSHYESNEVKRQSLCLLAAERINEALNIAQASEVKTAREFLSIVGSDITEIGSVDSSRNLCLWILDGMREVVRRMKGGEVAFKRGGHAYVLSILSSYDTQRTTITGSPVPGTVDLQNHPFQTPNTLEMVRKSRFAQQVHGIRR